MPRLKYSLKCFVNSQQDILLTDFVNERLVRKLISELRKEGVIYIPVESKLYRHIDLCTVDQIETFAKKQLAHMKKQYFNTLKPLNSALQDVKLKEMIGALDLWQS